MAHDPVEPDPEDPRERDPIDEALRAAYGDRGAEPGERRFPHDEQRLVNLVSGEQSSRDAIELLYAARRASRRRLFTASAKLWGQAFDLEPRLLCVAGEWRREAVSAVAQAVVGLGEDARRIGAEEQVRLREQALFWLRLELDYRRELMARGDEPSGLRGLGLLFSRPDLAGLREVDALAALSPTEAEKWNSFWDEVRSLLEIR